VFFCSDGDETVKSMVEEHKEWFESIFDSIIPWDNDIVVADKFIWVCIRGLPLHFWSRRCFGKYCGHAGNVN